MGQYYLIVNLDKREYLHPHRFGEGLKSREWLWSGMVPRALSVLLIDGDGRGGGDVNNDLCGRWAGDRIVIGGDYADDGKFLDSETENVFSVASDSYTDISELVIDALQGKDIGGGDYSYSPPHDFEKRI
jgi:hypothetical protein